MTLRTADESEWVELETEVFRAFTAVQGHIVTLLRAAMRRRPVAAGAAFLSGLASARDQLAGFAALRRGLASQIMEAHAIDQDRIAKAKQLG